MTQPATLLLQEPDSRTGGVRRLATEQELPAGFVRSAGRRLQIVALAMAIGVALLLLVVPLLTGKLHKEFESTIGWLPDVVNLVASLGVFALVRSGKLAPSTLINVGLLYEVLAAAFIALATYPVFFQRIDAWDEGYEFLGPGWVAVWMMFFAVLVPARPAKALVASLVAASTVPITVWFAMRSGAAPRLEASTFVPVWVLPYLIVTATASFANLVLYRLGREIRRAQELGSYQLERRLGQGGMGEVWRARHRMLARPAAIKLIRADDLGTGGASESALARFHQEAEATALLQSPHTVELYDFGISDDGRLYYVMELLDGVDLESLVQEHGPMPQERVVHVLTQACASLAEAHERDLIHRDIKPANIVLTRFALEYDFVKVLDFGLVKQRSQLDGEASGLSQTGVVTGTPAYLAPELALGEDSDGRADIYALGCVAHWLLTGELLFEEATAMKMVVAHVTKEPEPPSAIMDEPPMPELERLIMACLAKKPSDRPPTAEALAGELARLELSSPWTQERSAAWWKQRKRSDAADKSV